jgi:hypothetical protein
MPEVQDVMGPFWQNGSILMPQAMRLAQAGSRHRNRRVQIFLGRIIPSPLAPL